MNTTIDKLRARYAVAHERRLVAEGVGNRALQRLSAAEEREVAARFALRRAEHDAGCHADRVPGCLACARIAGDEMSAELAARGQS